VKSKPKKTTKRKARKQRPDIVRSIATRIMAGKPYTKAEAKLVAGSELRSTERQRLAVELALSVAQKRTSSLVSSAAGRLMEMIEGDGWKFWFESKASPRLHDVTALVKMVAASAMGQRESK
jgi:hypothetical protein